jgi:hypothetical protein
MTIYIVLITTKETITSASAPTTETVMREGPNPKKFEQDCRLVFKPPNWRWITVLKDTLTTRTTIDRQVWCGNMSGILEIEYSLHYSILAVVVKAIAKNRNRLELKFFEQT